VSGAQGSPAQGNRLPRGAQGFVQRALSRSAEALVWGVAALALLLCALLLALSLVAALATM
jgi:hypothetical protein